MIFSTRPAWITFLAWALVATSVPLSATKRLRYFDRFPESSDVKGVRVDSNGMIYVVGNTARANDGEPNQNAAIFIAKYRPDGTQAFKTFIDGSGQDTASGLAIAPDGGVYIVGTTTSTNFPTTPGTPQSTLGSSAGQSFVAKLSSDGQIQAATYFGGAAHTEGKAAAVDSAGRVYITGTSEGEGFPLTPGYSGVGYGFFLARMNGSLSEIQFATLAHGGTTLALDSRDYIYTAAAYTPPYSGTLPNLASPGAFQTQAQLNACWGSGIVFFSCSYQFVEKLNPTATVLSYATYLTGNHGASPAGIVVDELGNAIVAGTTNSSDFPVTPHALQAIYKADAPAPPPPVSPHPPLTPPPPTGFVAKLNATGTALIWSTYFGGSVEDAISGVAIDAQGYTYITGPSNSPDLPGVAESSPAGCAPTANQGLGFVARLSPDGTSLSATQVILGTPVCAYAGCSGNRQVMSSNAWALAITAQGTAIAGGPSGAVAAVDFLGSERLACLADPADNVQLRSVAPGQVLAIFGHRLISSPNALSAAGSLESLTGVSVSFNGVSAPVLYASTDQVNVQVPYEMVDHDSVEMQVTNAEVELAEQRTLTVVPRQPSIFLSADALLSAIPGYSQCGMSVSTTQHALAINSDGTINSCEHPAPPGSTVTIFANGFGQVQPAFKTGETTPAPASAITPSATGGGVLATMTSPGSISGLVEIHVKVGEPGFTKLQPIIEGISTREPIGIWVASQ